METKKTESVKYKAQVHELRFIESILSRPAWLTFSIILMAFLAATIFLWISGYNPGYLYYAIIRNVLGIDLLKIGSKVFFNARLIAEWLTTSVPLILTGLSMAFALKVGLWNIGAEGQYTMGMTATILAAFYLPPIPVLHSILAILIGIIAGGLWGAIIGWFKARYQVSEVVGTIMMNYIALYTLRILVRGIPGTNTFKTPDFPATALLQSDFLRQITNNSRLNLGILWLVGAALVYYIILEKTSLGLSLKITGLNPEAARYAGVKIKRNLIFSMFLAGAFAGLAGAIVTLGSYDYARLLSGMDNYGFTGITVALVSQGATLPTIYAGLLFGALQAAQGAMQLQGIPSEIVQIIIGLIVTLIAFQTGLSYLLRKRRNKLRQRITLAAIEINQWQDNAVKQ